MTMDKKQKLVSLSESVTEPLNPSQLVKTPHF